jgi:hypothetical protein
VTVDGTDREDIAVNGVAETPLPSGPRSISLSGLAPNCTIDGPPSRSVTAIDAELVTLEFAVVCTATSGVIAVMVQASGEDRHEMFQATLDGASQFLVGPDGPGYFAPVSAGDHLVSLVGPSHCTVLTDPRSVTVNVGRLSRDTAEAVFSVTCEPPPNGGTLRITASTTGIIPASTRYTVMHEVYGYWDYGGTPTHLGDLKPNGTLVAKVEATGLGGYPYWNIISLADVPGNCRVRPNPTERFKVEVGDVIDIEFQVTCSP